jgi:hypothetical protein
VYELHSAGLLILRKRKCSAVLPSWSAEGCASASAGTIVCRIDPGLHDLLLEREGCRTVVMKGRQYRGFVCVVAGALK